MIGLIGRRSFLAVSFVVSARVSQTHPKTLTDESNSNEFIGVFLKPESKAILDRKLVSLGLSKSSSNAVILYSKPKKEESYVYEPLYGERAAFRLIEIKIEEGAMRGIGRVSTMMGPIADSISCRPTLLIGSAASANPCSILIEPNLILEGRVCNSKYLDGDCNCNFDRSSIVPSVDIREESQSNLPSPINPNEELECPLCRYMKAGPCADSFVAWQECMDRIEKNEGDMSECGAVTGRMTACMLEHEYYDVFVAGMSEKIEQVEDQKRSVKQPHHGKH